MQTKLMLLAEQEIAKRSVYFRSELRMDLHMSHSLTFEVLKVHHLQLRVS